MYHFTAVNRPILAVLIYAKNEQENITPEQRDALLSLIAADKAEHRVG